MSLNITTMDQWPSVCVSGSESCSRAVFECVEKYKNSGGKLVTRLESFGGGLQTQSVGDESQQPHDNQIHQMNNL